MTKIPEEFATCVYCRGPTRLGDSKEVYGTSYGPALLCANYPTCDAFVGCHATGVPKGTVANASCREWRKKAHAAFDVLWKSSPGRRAPKTRSDAYKWLADALSIPASACHIGMMEPDQCHQVIAACTERPLKGVVYVDWLMQNGWVLHGRPTPNCHLYCDELHLDRLHVMADKLFMKRAWLDDKGVVPHYDLVPAKRLLALKAGAIPIDTKAAFVRVYRPIRDMWQKHKHCVNQTESP